MKSVYNLLKTIKFLYLVLRMEKIRVVIYRPTGADWIAHGLEINYAAQGETVQAAFDNFLEGLARTMIANFESFGTIDQLWNPAPDEIFSFYEAGEPWAPEQTSAPRGVSALRKAVRDTVARATMALTQRLQLVFASDPVPVPAV